jgi:hypothetical protein
VSLSAVHSVKIIEHSNEFTPHFFIRQDFRSYQAQVFGKKIVSLGLFSKVDQSLLAHVCFAGQEGYWRNPIVGAFGGISIKKGTPIDAIETLLEKTPHLLAEHDNVNSVTIKLPPACFPDDSALIANILHRQNWHLADFDLNFHLAPRSIEAYLASLGHTKQKFIRRLNNAGALFYKIEHSMLETVYSVIQQNRAAQGYPMTMSLDAIAALIKNFQYDIKLFAVSLQERIVASAICIQVNPQYLYVFYWGELPEYRKESPVLLLSQGIVEYCVHNNIDIMDIGTSSENSIPNIGLCAFKSSLGCRISQKSTYSWKSL